MKIHVAVLVTSLCSALAGPNAIAAGAAKRPAGKTTSEREVIEEALAKTTAKTIIYFSIAKGLGHQFVTVVKDGQILTRQPIAYNTNKVLRAPASAGKKLKKGKFQLSDPSHAVYPDTGDCLNRIEYVTGSRICAQAPGANPFAALATNKGDIQVSLDTSRFLVNVLKNADPYEVIVIVK